ncbi:MAG: UDP-2,3-diacylglucosamine diphosphatase [Bacteroidia bacterium]
MKVFFVSDLHLGAPTYEASRLREKHFVQWMDSVKHEAQALFLVGDVFDFWFEFGKVVPQGYVRILGKLAEWADAGIPIHIFLGNHDLWYKNYLAEEFGATIHSQPFATEIFGKNYYIAHGDGLGPGDYGYKFIRSIFTNPICKWLFARLHPNLSVRLAEFSSRLSGSYTKRETEPTFYGEKEALLIHSKAILQQNPATNYFIYGHRHILRETLLSDSATCFYLGDWIRYFSYLEVSAENVQLKQYPR